MSFYWPSDFSKSKNAGKQETTSIILIIDHGLVLYSNPWLLNRCMASLWSWLLHLILVITCYSWALALKKLDLSTGNLHYVYYWHGLWSIFAYGKEFEQQERLGSLLWHLGILYSCDSCLSCKGSFSSGVLSIPFQFCKWEMMRRKGSSKQVD